MARILVSLSGGMDSATLLASALDLRHEVVGTIGFDYGSKHSKYESTCADHIARHYGVPYDLIDLASVGAMLRSNLLMSGGAIPEGHYQAASMTQTVVPGRNAIFAAILAGVAWSRGAVEVWLGIHAGDHAIYPDCRPAFAEAMDRAVTIATDGTVSMRAPFLCIDKAKILQEGLRLGVPYGLTRTCYKDQPTACGKCGACQERLEAFALNETVDPLEYDLC